MLVCRLVRPPLHCRIQFLFAPGAIVEHYRYTVALVVLQQVSCRMFHVPHVSKVSSLSSASHQLFPAQFLQ